MNSKLGNGRISSVFLGFLQQPLQMMKFVIISGVIILSTVVTYIFPDTYLGIFIALIIAIGLLIIFLRVPPIGLLGLIAVGMLVSFEFGTATRTRINLVLILLPLLIGLWLIDMLVREGKFRFTTSRTNPPLLAFLVFSLLAFGIGQINWFLYARQAPMISQFGGLAIFLLSIGAFIFTANIIENIKWLKRLVWFFIILGAIIIFSRMIPFIGQTVKSILPSENTGSLFWVWLAAISFSQLLLNRDLHKGLRFFLFGLVIATIYVALVQSYNWKSGWIPPLAAIGAITWIRFPRLRIVLAICAVFVINSMYADLIQSDEYSYITRIEAWKIMFNEIIKVNPLFGLGPANYRFYTPLFPILGYSIEFNSHNNYIDILAQVGLLGLIAFLWFAWEIFRLGWGLHKQELDNFSQAYVAGALGGLVGMLVAGMLGDWVLPFVYNVGLRGFRSSVLGWIFLGGLVVIGRIALTEKNKSQEE